MIMKGGAPAYAPGSTASLSADGAGCDQSGRSSHSEFWVDEAAGQMGDRRFD
jgi:hypothetical protein